MLLLMHSFHHVALIIKSNQKEQFCALNCNVKSLFTSTSSLMHQRNKVKCFYVLKTFSHRSQDKSWIIVDVLRILY